MQRLLKALGYSMDGLNYAWKSEKAFQQECILAALFMPLGCWLGDSGLERAALIAPILLVLIIEILNSAIETTINRISTDINPLSKIAKDLGSFAVLVALVLVVSVWGLVIFT